MSRPPRARPAALHCWPTTAKTTPNTSCWPVRHPGLSWAGRLGRAALTALLLPLLGGPAQAGRADQVLAALDAPAARAPAEARAAARLGARQPRDPTRGQTARASAWLVVGRLGVLEPEIVDQARLTLLEARTPPAVRARAAWALGELARGHSPGEVQPIAEALMAAMSTPLDPESAQQVVEAFAKAWGPHPHGVDADLQAARALNALAARQRAALPGAWGLVMDRVLSPALVVRLVADSAAAARAAPTPAHLAEAYSATLTGVRYLAAHSAPLIDRAPREDQTVQAAFDALMDSLTVPDRSLSLLVLWSMGEYAGDPAFARHVGPQLGMRAPDPDPVVRWMTGWALHRLRSDLEARRGLRQLISAEADPDTLRLLGGLRAPGEQDPLQRVFAVDPEGLK
ncbi:MAG: hypothetical protein JNM72_20510 [Deltaproteobacteria bacterium]|nr:hypothetical protein [Deltaproteobacteria bacterium]